MNNIDSQIRATFIDTKKAQNTLREELDILEYNNTYISDDKIQYFFELFADAFLGLDFDKKCIIYLPDKTSIQIKNFGQFIRTIVYYKKNNVDYEFLRRFGKIENINFPISILWYEVKFIAFGIFPEALATSVRISKEIVDHRREIKRVSTVQKNVQ